MSSIQDRIRRLQSADAPSPPTPPLTSQTSLPTQPTAPKPTPSNLSHRAAKFQPPPFTQTSSSSSSPPTSRDINPLNRRVEALQAGVHAGRLQHRVNRIQHATNNTQVGGLVDGKMAIFESRAGETGLVGRTVGTLERGGQHQTGANGAWNDAGALVGRMGVFEKGEAGKATDVLLGRKAMFEPTDQRNEKLPVLNRAPLSGAAHEEPGEGRAHAAQDARLLKKAARFEGDGDGNDGGKSKADDKQEARLLERAAMFEQGTAEVDHKGKQGNEEAAAQVEEEKGLLQRAAMFEAQQPAEEEVQVERKESGLLKRAAWFEKAQDGDKKEEAARHAPVVGGGKKAATRAEESGKDGQETSGKSLVDELREVKATNESLLGTLIELTGAFRRLEKSREEMQERLKRLENAHAV